MATKYRAFSRLDRTVLSGTWFGLDWGKMQIADFARIKNGKIMKSMYTSNLLDGHERPSLGILDIIGKRM